MALVVIFVTSLFMGGCSEPTPSPAPVPSPAPSPPPELAAPEPIKIIHTIHLPPPPAPPAVAIEAVQMENAWIANEIDKRTEGRVQIELAWGAPFGPPTEFLSMVGRPGVADSAMVVLAYHKRELPLTSTTCLPFIAPDMDVQGMATAQLYKEWAPLREEWEPYNVTPLFWFSCPQASLVCREPVRTLEDFKGLTLFGSSFSAATEKLLGATPVSMPAGEAYDAIAKGTLDGAWFPHSGSIVFKYYEHANYITDLGFFGGAFINPWSVNTDVWNSIPQADQEAIMSIEPEVNVKFGEFLAATYEKIFDEFGAAGLEFLSLPDEDIAEMKEIVVENLWTDWLDEMEEMGVVDGRECLERYQALVERYTSQAAVMPPWPSE